MSKMNPYSAAAYPFAFSPFGFYYGAAARQPHWGFPFGPFGMFGPYGKPEHPHHPHAGGKSYACGASEGKPAAQAAASADAPEQAAAPLAQAPKQGKAGALECGPHKKRFGLLRTDVKETDEAYKLLVNLPGFKKEDVKVTLKDGYLSINAETSHDTEEKDEEGTYIRKERYCGSCTRSFYVGEDILDDGITAKFDDGVLSIDVPKDLKALEEKAPTEIAVG